MAESQQLSVFLGSLTLRIRLPLPCHGLLAFGLLVDQDPSSSCCSLICGQLHILAEQEEEGFSRLLTWKKGENMIQRLQFCNAWHRKSESTFDPQHPSSLFARHRSRGLQGLRRVVCDLCSRFFPDERIHPESAVFISIQGCGSCRKNSLCLGGLVLPPSSRAGCTKRIADCVLKCCQTVALWDGLDVATFCRRIRKMLVITEISVKMQWREPIKKSFYVAPVNMLVCRCVPV